MSNPQSVSDDEWHNAVSALIARSTPDAAPLARLLRSSAPIPEGVRDTLAELLLPGKPEFLFARLVLKKDDSALLKVNSVQIPAVSHYERARLTGASDPEATQSVEDAKIVGARSVYRYREWFKEFRARLSGH
jgi:hypothetical protein